MYRLPYLINATALLGLLALRGTQTWAAVAFEAGFAISLLLVSPLVPASVLDPVTVKAYSALLNLITFFPTACLDAPTALTLLTFFWMPYLLYFKWLVFTPSVSRISSTTGGGKLFLGNIKVAADESFIKKEDITHIVEVHDANFRNQQQIHGVTYLSFQFEDRNYVDISEELIQSTAFITQALTAAASEKQTSSSNITPGSVLVHCSAGVSRSAALVIGYIMACKNIGAEEALQQVRACRSVVHPNSGFMDCLHSYEKNLVSSK